MTTYPKLSSLIGFLVLVARATAALATEVPFAPQSTITGAANGASSVFAADVDGDGDMDALSASKFADEISWYDNDGAWTAHNIGTGADGASSVFAADVDGDGDMDALSASSNDDKIAWYVNDGTPANGGWTAHTISTAANGPTSVFAADVDGDGDVDVLSASQVDNKIAWYVNDGTPTVGAWTALTINTAANGAFSVFAADVDGDGDVDVLSASFTDNKIAWYKNDGTPADGGWTALTISTAAIGAFSVFAADVDGDGDVDVLSASQTDDKIAWYQNDGTPGNGGWTTRTIGTIANGADSVFAADVDGDGDVDAFSASSLDDKIAWYENDGTPADGGWTARTISTAADGATSVFAADADGDGDVDALSTSTNDDKIAWYENRTIHRNAVFSAEITIHADVSSPAAAVVAADVDGDGDMDALSASFYDYKIAWYENVDGAGTFDLQQSISEEAQAAQSVFAADVDGDGDVDALSTSYYDNKIAWYENVDGAGSFGPRQLISSTASGAYSVFAADVDGDGDVDALSASQLDNKIAWYENDGTPANDSAWEEHPISTAAIYAFSVFAADVDGDGDVDALSASYFDNKIAWYENVDGAGSFGPQQVIWSTALGAFSVFAADVDGDGDLDALSASYFDDKIAWYENVDGAGSFGPQREISSTVGGAISVFVADVDGDGDVDVLAASQTGLGVSWFENLGAGTFGAQHVISTDSNRANSVFAADVDGDGDVDVFAALEEVTEIVWYENRGGQFGLATTNSAPSTIFDGQVSPVLTVTLTHNGRLGDTHAEWASLDLLFEETPGDALTSTEANAMFETVEIHRVFGPGPFELGALPPLAILDSLTLDGAGHQRITFDDGTPGALVTQDSPGTFIVGVRMASFASSEPTGSFRITHAQSSSTADDWDRDIPLRQEFALDASSALVAIGAAAGRVPDGDDAPGVPLRLGKSGGNLNLSWGASCRGTDTDYTVYEGMLRNFTSHVPKLCGTGGAMSATITAAPGNRYYLVVPLSPDGVEGSYGVASNGTSRPASGSACLPQLFAGCP